MRNPRKHRFVNLQMPILLDEVSTMSSHLQRSQKLSHETAVLPAERQHKTPGSAEHFQSIEMIATLCKVAGAVLCHIVMH